MGLKIEAPKPGLHCLWDTPPSWPHTPLTQQQPARGTCSLSGPAAVLGAPRDVSSRSQEAPDWAPGLAP